MTELMDDEDLAALVEAYARTVVTNPKSAVVRDTLWALTELQDRRRAELAAGAATRLLDENGGTDG